MKPQHLVPVFLLALTVPGFASAGTGVTQKGGCGCSHVQKGAPKSAPCGCGATQKHAQKSSGPSCGCGIAQKGSSHAVVQKGYGVHQKSHGVAQKSKGGCSTCCLAVIPAVLNEVDHIVTSTVEHVLSPLFACNSCGVSGKSVSKGCGCNGSSKVGVPGLPPGIQGNPFEDDDLQPPPLPSTEALHRVQRRPIHREVTQATPTAAVVRPAPRALTISVAHPLAQPSAPSQPQATAVIRTVSGESQAPRIPHNPLRAK